MKYRDQEVSYYPWSLTSWLTSRTRAELDMAGRGIYRELIDHCYAQGSIPSDPATICRLVGCTGEELARTWPKIKRHFTRVRRDSDALEHAPATLFRRNFFAQGKRNSANASARWQQSGKAKANADSEIGCDRIATASESAMLIKKRKEKKEKKHTLRASAEADAPATPDPIPDPANPPSVSDGWTWEADEWERVLRRRAIESQRWTGIEIGVRAAVMHCASSGDPERVAASFLDSFEAWTQYYADFGGNRNLARWVEAEEYTKKPPTREPRAVQGGGVNRQAAEAYIRDLTAKGEL